MVRGQEYAKIISEGSIRFGKGSAPTDAMFTAGENRVITIEKFDILRPREFMTGRYLS